MAGPSLPHTLIEFQRRFGSEEACEAFLADLRWPDGFVCPKCGGTVFDTETGYLCEKSQADSKPCRFKISREILQQPIEPAQAQKLLATRKTDLIDKFISKAGRPFPAYLVMDDKGKVTFEFPPREEEK